MSPATALAALRFADPRAIYCVTSSHWTGQTDGDWTDHSVTVKRKGVYRLFTGAMQQYPWDGSSLALAVARATVAAFPNPPMAPLNLPII